MVDATSRARSVAAASRAGDRPLLTRRRLSRATLARQWLLRRAPVTVLDAVTHLVAIQAQEANAPYVGLWTRLTTFDRQMLADTLTSRAVVRSSVLRGTQHLVTTADFHWLRPLMQPVLDRGRRAAFGRATAGLDLDELAAAGRAELTGRTLTRPELGRALAARWPDHDPSALAWSVQTLVPIVHPPPSGLWGARGATPFTLAADWIPSAGPPAAPEVAVRTLVERYLAAFGPASVRDIQVWSGLTRLREVVEPLPLRTYRDEAGTILYDLPDAVLPDADEPAPVRFLPDYDDLLVAHADRTRIIADADRRRVITASLVRPTVLIDGVVSATWSVDRGGGTVRVTPFTPLSADDRAAIETEGESLGAFLATQGDPPALEIDHAGDSARTADLRV